MRLDEAARLMGADAPRDAPLDVAIAGFAVDSRAIEPGHLFFALSPEDYRRHYFTATSFTDAHRFIPEAFARGAVGAVARRARVVGDGELERFADRLLLVEDVIEALQKLAHGVVRNWGGPVVAIAGSAGKTTTKDLTALVLQTAGKRVVKSIKNFNNELGVPLSILQMESGGRTPNDFDVAVIEMGTSMPGELERLAQIAPPKIAVEVCVGPEHLEFLGTIEDVAREESALVRHIRPGGVAILNADDPWVMWMAQFHRGPRMTFGIRERADVSATEIEALDLDRLRFRLQTPRGRVWAELPLAGRHNLSNALAAAAVATCFEIAPELIAEAFARARPSEMRGEILRFAQGFTVIDDSYNSNPASLLAMARAVAEADAKRRIIVAGEMLELGPKAAELHREAGREIAGLPIDVLWGVRGLAEELVSGARASGMKEARFFASVDDAAQALRAELRSGDLVLIKGSRGVRTDRIVTALKESFALEGEDALHTDGGAKWRFELKGE
ncbi:UDP-N-acetylmuramoyl-tripeptide--D-alanyl-D-alanine ligase [Pyrinomonas methylaliphatogenes]|nr:UDP-N-acetylmuramoyl-tripeptide--D-alanyl-D-alanine ligase [Pyrinomonas methylaliphatogenes]